MEVSPHALFSWFLRHRHKFGAIAVGHTAKRIEEFVVDWLIYGAVVLWATQAYGAWWGSIVAFLIMTPLMGLACLAYIKLYDWAQIDWFGFELIKEWRDEEKHEHWMGRMMHRIARMGSVPAFIVLSIHADAFMTVVYFRKKHAQYAGLNKRDWSIFLGSLLLSNAYWTMRWTVIFTAIQFIWRYFSL